MLAGVQNKLIIFSYLSIITVLGACSTGDGGDPVPDPNEAPIANAGANQNVVVSAVVTLSGVGSTDDSGIESYLWEQIGGPDVAITNADMAVATFTASSQGTLTFRLTVTDGDEAEATDEVSITVGITPPPPPPPNVQPVANAGPDQTVDANTTVMLDGTGSTDSNGVIVSYQWTQISGSSVVLDNNNIAQPTFTAPSTNGVLSFQLVVTDDDSASSIDSVTITVENGIAMQAGLDSRPNNMNCVAPDTVASAPESLELVDVFPSLSLEEAQFPLGLYQLPGNSDYFYILTRDGFVLRFDNDAGATSITVVLDISLQINDFGSEGGLLSMAFHPNVDSNGAVYLSYTTSGGGAAGQSVISRFTMINEGEIDPSSEQVVLSVNQPAGNHNGGDIAFGPDGYLYVGFGDGGGSNDFFEQGQNPNTLLAAMLRIDVDPTTDEAPFYSIPADNPFANSGGAPEVFAYGLRNPFRFSFDVGTGILWAGDVGQGAREEIDHIVNGGNYGWPNQEGNICHSAPCTSYIDPVHSYSRSVGNSVTGGYVYRGTEIPSLNGAYVFGDYGSGRIWTLTPGASALARTEVAVAPNSAGIVSFAQDNEGEVYVLLAFPSDGRSILKLQLPSGSTAGSNIPDLLSETGCFDSNDPSQPASGLISYDVISELWSDGAEKERWMALPNGETVDVDNQGDFDFPTGTILSKHFMNAGTMIETRLLMLHETGWAGYSYQWRDDQTDADLLNGPVDATVAGLNWHYPGAAECRQCHTQVKNFALGPEVLQLNNDFTYPETTRTANQIFTLNHVGVFSAPPNGNLNDATMFALDDADASLEQRAKSYLHSNCSNCHQPGGTGEGNMDLRFETSFEQMGVCDVVPSNNLGNPDARLIAPGSPANSIILQRMQASAASGNRMPPLASSVVDIAAVTVFTDWINGVSCP